MNDYVGGMIHKELIRKYKIYKISVSEAMKIVAKNITYKLKIIRSGVTQGEGPPNWLTEKM